MKKRGHRIRACYNARANALRMRLCDYNFALYHELTAPYLMPLSEVLESYAEEHTHCRLLRNQRVLNRDWLERVRHDENTYHRVRRIYNTKGKMRPDIEYVVNNYDKMSADRWRKEGAKVVDYDDGEYAINPGDRPDLRLRRLAHTVGVERYDSLLVLARTNLSAALAELTETERKMWTSDTDPILQTYVNYSPTAQN